MEDFRVRSRGGLGLAALFAATVLSGAAWAADTPDLSGIYWATEYHPKIQLVGGGDLPLTAKGKAAYEKNMAGLKDGSISDNARKFCVPDGLPRVLANPYPFEIIHGPPGQTTIIYELSHQVRAIAMNKPLPEEELIAFPAYQRPLRRPFRGRHAGGRDGRLQREDVPRRHRRAAYRRDAHAGAHPQGEPDRSSRTSSPSTIPNTTRGIGRRASSTRCATTCGSKTMSAASRIATSRR